MEWKSIESREEFNRLADKFQQAMSNTLGIGSTHAMGDVFGGTLLCAYLPSGMTFDKIESTPLQPALIEELERLAEKIKEKNNEADEELIKDLLMQAYIRYAVNLNHKIWRATSDLTREVLNPLYNAAGLEQHWSEIIYQYVNREGGYEGTSLVVKDIKNGLVRPRVVKQLKAGRPSQWKTQTLEREIKRSAKKVIRSRGKLTLHNVVEEMNKQRDAQTQTTNDAVKQALTRNGLTWKSIKRAVINR
jgi:hypothetical protein